MLIFVAVFLFTFAAVNLYVFRWVRAGLGLKRRGTAWLLAFLLVMVFMPLALHSCRSHKFETAERLLGVTTYCWMAVVMWIVCFGFVAELWNLGVRMAALRRPERRRLLLPARRVLWIITGIVVLLSIWGSIEVRGLKLDTVCMDTSKMVPGAEPVRILHMSDLHLGQAVSPGGMLDKLTRLYREMKPDMIVCTGDLLDGSRERVREDLAALAQMNPTLGKFAVLGNHEFYVGVGESLEALGQAGFTTLRAEHVTITNEHVRIRIAGVDDLAGRQMGMRHFLNEEKALPPADDIFTILLKHQPLINKRSLGRFDLQLSGHLHGGQVFPFQLFVWLVYGTFTGLHDIQEGVHLHVSPGAGAWGPPIRVLAPPRVTLIVVNPGR